MKRGKGKALLGLLPHRLSLRLFLRWGLDWALCGEETSFFRSLVGEGGPVPLPIWIGRKKEKDVLSCRMAHSVLLGATVPGSHHPMQSVLQASGGLYPISGSSLALKPLGQQILGRAVPEGPKHKCGGHHWAVIGLENTFVGRPVYPG